MITSQQLNAWRDAAKRLPDAPWHEGTVFDEGYITQWFDHAPALREGTPYQEVTQDEEDRVIPIEQIVAFAQVAREALPALIAELERLTQAVYGSRGWPTT